MRMMIKNEPRKWILDDGNQVGAQCCYDQAPEFFMTKTRTLQGTFSYKFTISLFLLYTSISSYEVYWVNMTLTHNNSNKGNIHKYKNIISSKYMEGSKLI